MKKIIIVTLLFSVLGHLFFFGILDADIKLCHQMPAAGLSIISIEQFNYIKSIGVRTENILLSEFPKSLFAKNSIWEDSLNIIDSHVLISNIDLSNESTGETEIKPYDFGGIYISELRIDHSPFEYLPRFGDVFLMDLPIGEGSAVCENTIILNEGKIKLTYFIQGPAASRILILDNSSQKRIRINNRGITSKFRFWTSKDGRINQVIVEEGTSFSMIDSEIMKLIKTWRFNPVYIQSYPDYEWGVITVKVEK